MHFIGNRSIVWWGGCWAFTFIVVYRIWWHLPTSFRQKRHLPGLMTFATYSFRRYSRISEPKIVVSATKIGVSASEMSFTIHFRCENRGLSVQEPIPTMPTKRRCFRFRPRILFHFLFCLCFFLCIGCSWNRLVATGCGWIVFGWLRSRGSFRK